MRLAIDHRIRFRFAQPQPRLVRMLRVTPQNSHDQTVADWRIDVDRDVRMRTGCDGWGNAVTMLYVEGPLDALEVVVTGEVVTSHSDGVLHGVTERLPPALFLRDTPATPHDPEGARWAAGIAAGIAGGAERLTALRRVNAALHADASSPAGPHLAGARDLAHRFVAAARSLGAPARYVAGFGLADGDGVAHPHGWAEAHVEDVGWIGFDPTLGRLAEDGHVRIAVALDALGAAPVAGARPGEIVDAPDGAR